jgi:tyrosyl-tRNA synthetase
LSAPDESLRLWYELLLGEEPPGDVPPRDAKRTLARRLVARFHSDEAAADAEEAFDRQFVRHEQPEHVPEITWPRSETVHLPAVLAEAFGISTSEARRMIGQGGVKLDGEPVADGAHDMEAAAVDGKVLQLGKRRFVRVNLS